MEELETIQGYKMIKLKDLLKEGRPFTPGSANQILALAVKKANLNSKVKSLSKKTGNFAQVEFKDGSFLSVYANKDGSIDGDYETPKGKHEEYIFSKDRDVLKHLISLLKKVW